VPESTVRQGELCLTGLSMAAYDQSNSGW